MEYSYIAVCHCEHYAQNRGTIQAAPASKYGSHVTTITYHSPYSLIILIYGKQKKKKNPLGRLLSSSGFCLVIRMTSELRT